MEHNSILDILIPASSGSLSVTLNEAELQNVLSKIKNTHSIPINKIGLNQSFIDLDLFGFSIKKLRLTIDQIDIGKNKLILHLRILNINSLIMKVLSPIIRKIGLDIRTDGQVTLLDVSSLLVEKTMFLPQSILQKLDDVYVSVNVDTDRLTIVLNIE